MNLKVQVLKVHKEFTTLIGCDRAVLTPKWPHLVSFSSLEMLASGESVSLLSLVHLPYSSLLYVRAEKKLQNWVLEPTLAITEKSHSGKTVLLCEWEGMG